MESRPPHPSRRVPSGIWGLALGAVALALVAGTVPRSDATHRHAVVDEAVTAAAVTPPVTHRDVTADQSLRITQANLKSGETAYRFNSDVGKVLAGAPDFITYNEVPFRADGSLAPPPGYALWRTPGQYSGEVPVAWRTDRWTPDAQGTLRTSNVKTRLSWQHVSWGIRYANWVTLHDAYGRTISVISTHLTPIISITEGLQAKEVNHLGALVQTLSAAGPVLMAGDFNQGYQSSDYLRSLYAKYNLVPSYDALGTHFPTGDHQGATIDYVFLHQDLTSPVLTFTDHFPTTLYSDHNAVTADLAWNTLPTTTYTIARGTVTNDPAGTADQRRAVLQKMTDAVDHTPTGAAIHLASRMVSTPSMWAAVNRAIDRGVHVQIVIRSKDLSPAALAVQERIGNHPKRKSFLVRCTTECAQRAARIGVPPTELLLSTVETVPAVRIVSDQPLTTRATRVLTTARVTTGQVAYDRAFRRFFRLVGLPL
jgi:endonuclease/exonuclease/phosphatase family metal-dependent hydrolase